MERPRSAEPDAPPPADTQAAEPDVVEIFSDNEVILTWRRASPRSEPRVA